MVAMLDIYSFPALRLALLAAGAILPVGLAASPPASGEWNVTDHLPAERIIIQGHRGVGGLAEENTLEAFQLAWRMGIYPESDLRMTRDGVIVPFHDNNFSRVVKDAPPDLRKKGVQDLTYAELAQLDVGSWRGEQFKGRHVLPMSAVFEMMRGHPERHLYMDVKSIDLPRLAREVRHHGIEQQIVLASRRVEQLRAWKALMPESATLLWMHGNMAELTRDLTALRAEKFAGITQVQIHVYPKVTHDAWAPPADASPEDNPFRLPNAFLRQVGEDLRAHGILFQTFPYTAEAKVYGQLLDLGVMSFATDHPDVALREIKAYYATRRATTP